MKKLLKYLPIVINVLAIIYLIVLKILSDQDLVDLFFRLRAILIADNSIYIIIIINIIFVFTKTTWRLKLITLFLAATLVAIFKYFYWSIIPF